MCVYRMMRAVNTKAIEVKYTQTLSHSIEPVDKNAPPTMRQKEHTTQNEPPAHRTYTIYFKNNIKVYPSAQAIRSYPVRFIR